MKRYETIGHRTGAGFRTREREASRELVPFRTIPVFSSPSTTFRYHAPVPRVLEPTHPKRSVAYTGLAAAHANSHTMAKMKRNSDEVA